MSKSKKSALSTQTKGTCVKKLSGEQQFFRTLEWAKYYVDYKTGLIEHDDLDEHKVLAYAMHLNDITEEGKYPI